VEATGWVTITVTSGTSDATTSSVRIDSSPGCFTYTGHDPVAEEVPVLYPPEDEWWIVDLWDDPPELDGPRTLVTLKGRLRYPVAEP